MSVLFVYALWLLGSRDNLYVSIVAWMLFIQAVQLIIGKVLILVEIVKNGTVKLFEWMIEAAPTLDMTTRSRNFWGEPDYPEEEDHI